MINYENFVVFPKDVAKDSPYHFSDITYDINLQDKVTNDKGAIVLYFSNIDDSLVEIQTKGDGSCLFYSTETINSIEHIFIKLRLLKVNIGSCLKNYNVNNIQENSIFEDCIQFANQIITTPTESCIMKYLNDIDSTIKAISLIEEEGKDTGISTNIKNKLIEAFKDYKYHRIGFGLELSDAVNRLKEIKQPSMMHVYPMPKWQLEKIAKDTQLPIEEIKGFDNWKEENEFNMEYLNKDKEILHIMFRRGHFSRMIPIDKVPELAHWCDMNKVDLIKLNIDE